MGDENRVCCCWMLLGEVSEEEEEESVAGWTMGSLADEKEGDCPVGDEEEEDSDSDDSDGTLPSIACE